MQSEVTGMQLILSPKTTMRIQLAKYMKHNFEGIGH